MHLTDSLHSTVEWTVKEWRRKGSRVVKEVALRRKNLQTDYGLTAYAAAFQGTYNAPVYLVIENEYASIQDAGGLAVNATSMSVDKDFRNAGDTACVVGVGTANQETLTISNWTGTGPYTVTFASGCTKSHAQYDPVVRVVLATDLMANVQAEAQYDSTNAPNQRMQSLGGYSQGQSNWTMQFFLAGTQALSGTGTALLFGNVGLADSVTVGAGNLHNHLSLGYNHQPGNDAEIDVSLTLS